MNGSSGQKRSLLHDSQASALETSPHVSSSNCTAGPPPCTRCAWGAHEERQAHTRPGPATCGASSGSEQVVSARQRGQTQPQLHLGPGGPLSGRWKALDLSMACGKGLPSSQWSLVLETCPLEIAPRDAQALTSSCSASVHCGQRPPGSDLVTPLTLLVNSGISSTCPSFSTCCP